MNWTVKKIDSCPSTNTLLNEWLLDETATTGTVLIAKNQTKGRGRYDRTWIAPNGNLNISLALDTEKHADKPYLFNLLPGLAVCQAINHLYKINALVKWPNDVLIGDLKVAGILSSALPEKNAAIIGVGINLNSQISDFPAELQPILTTVLAESNTTTDESDFLDLFLDIFSSLLDNSFKKGQEWLIEEVNNNLAWKNNRVSISDNETPVCEGILIGLDNEGFLTVKTDGDEIKTIISGDVSLCS